MRRHRARANRGAFCITYEMFEGLVEVLVDGGFLKPEFADDEAAIKRAFEQYVESARPIEL